MNAPAQDVRVLGRSEAAIGQTTLMSLHHM